MTLLAQRKKSGGNELRSRLVAVGVGKDCMADCDDFVDLDLEK